MRLWTFILCSVFAAHTNDLKAQKITSNLEFFEGNQDSVIFCKLQTDLSKFRKDRNKDSVQRAVWGFYFSEKDSTDLKVKLTPRGNFRRSHCMTTPFKVNFKKSDFKNSSVKDYDKLKVVTHCRNSKVYEQNLHIEYLIYKAYQMLTDYSFRVKLLNIEYIDEGPKKTKTSNHYGFFIEDIDQVASRNNSVEISQLKLSFDYLDPEHMVLMDFFQYMIGNTDYSIPHLHNVKLVKENDPNKPLPITIPYDFDYSGIINASYAVPNEKLGIKTVTERLYRGVCTDKKYFDSVRQRYLDKEDEIIRIFEDDPYLDKLNRNKALNYLKGFFEIIGNDRAYNHLIFANCRDV